MSAVTFKLEVNGLKEMNLGFLKASGGLPPKSLLQFTQTFNSVAEAVNARVHVQTGYLKGTGRHDTHYDGKTISLDIEYAGDPGIFELWRGKLEEQAGADHEKHPEGHFFFNAVEPFLPKISADLDSVFDEYFNKIAPI